MERVIDYDIVFYYPIEAFTQFDASVQTQIVINVAAAARATIAIFFILIPLIKM